MYYNEGPKKLVVLSSLLVPFMLIDDPNYAYGEAPKMLLPTANGSTFVEIIIDKGIVGDNTFAIDSPQEVKFDVTFLHPGAFDPITHVNYEFHVADESGNMLVQKTGLHLHDGMDTQAITLPTMGSFTLTIDVIGTGLSEPYDTANSGCECNYSGNSRVPVRRYSSDGILAEHWYSIYSVQEPTEALNKYIHFFIYSQS